MARRNGTPATQSPFSRASRARTWCANPSGSPETAMRGVRPLTWLEQSDGAAFVVDVDVEGRGALAEAGHRLHVAAECDEPAGAAVRAYVADRDHEARRRIGQRDVVRERQVRLGHADRQPVEAV